MGRRRGRGGLRRPAPVLLRLGRAVGPDRPAAGDAHRHVQQHLLGARLRHGAHLRAVPGGSVPERAPERQRWGRQDVRRRNHGEEPADRGVFNLRDGVRVRVVRRASHRRIPAATRRTLAERFRGHALRDVPVPAADAVRGGAHLGRGRAGLPVRAGDREPVAPHAEAERGARTEDEEEKASNASSKGRRRRGRRLRRRGFASRGGGTRKLWEKQKRRSGGGARAARRERRLAGGRGGSAGGARSRREGDRDGGASRRRRRRRRRRHRRRRRRRRDASASRTRDHRRGRGPNRSRSRFGIGRLGARARWFARKRVGRAHRRRRFVVRGFGVHRHRVR